MGDLLCMLNDPVLHIDDFFCVSRECGAELRKDAAGYHRLQFLLVEEIFALIPASKEEPPFT